MLLWLQLMPLLNLNAPVNDPGEFLDVFHFFQVLFVYFLYYFEWSMTFTEYLVDSLAIVVLLVLLNFHAVSGSFGAFNVEIDLTFGLEAFDDGANFDAFLATNDASMVELLVVEPDHSYRRLRRDRRPRCPHGTAMVHPHVQSVCHGSIRRFQHLFVSSYEMAIILRNTMILLFMLIEIQFNCILFL